MSGHYWVVTTAWATLSDTIGLRLLRLTIIYSVFTALFQRYYVGHGDIVFRILFFSSPTAICYPVSCRPCHPGLLFRQLDVLIFVISLINPFWQVYVAVNSFNLSQELFYAFPALYCFLLTLFLRCKIFEIELIWLQRIFLNFNPTFL